MSVAELRGDLVILACAVSAGVHGALVPAHLEQAVGAGIAFVGAAAALAVLVVWLTWRPASRTALVAAGATFAGLLAGYALAITTGVPLMHPGPEPVEAVALATKSVEALGLLAAASLLRGRRSAGVLSSPRGTPA